MHLPGGLHWESVSGGWCLRSLWKSPGTRWGLWGILKGEAHLVSRVSPSADLEFFFFFFFQNLVDWCSQSPCQNGGRCVQTGAYCICPPGWSGRLCDIKSLPCKEAAAQMGERQHVLGV